MIQKLLKLLDRIRTAEKVYAHCDIPCGLYNTDALLLATRTIEKMIQKIKAFPHPEINASVEEWNEYNNAFIRMILEKEEQGEICKKEILILWADYFQPEDLKLFPDLHRVFWQAVKSVSKCKQTADKNAVDELKAAAMAIDLIFKKTEAARKKT